MSAIPALTQVAPQEIVAQSLPRSSAKTAEAAEQFEGMLMGFIFQQMRQTVTHSDLFGGQATARSTYEYLLDQAVSSNAMKAGKGWGLSQKLEAEWGAAKVKGAGTP